jgi:alkyldihydroxyacetonephosphate synthase
MGGGIDGLTVGNVFDSAGTFDYLETIHQEMRNAVTRIKGAVFAAHFSHWYKTGGMMYPYAYVNADSPEEMTDLYFKLQKQAVGAILKCGGTINHHHGIGMTLGPYMRDEFGASYDVLQKVKNVLDPNNIMNPGKLGFEE